MEQARKKQKQIKSQTNLITALSAMLLITVLTVSLLLFARYTQEQLYQECVSQLSEISGQLFEKMEVQLNIQWGYLDKMDDDLKGREILTEDELTRFLLRREQELSPVGQSMEFLAMDSHGYYYTDHGQQGLWTGATKVDDSERQSFLINDWLTSANKMALVLKLSHPLDVDGADITHFILLKDMDEMAPYFRSSAFHNQNSTFVLDSNGVRMFEDNILPGLNFEGRNIYHTLREQSYDHLGSFDACLDTLEEKSFVCTDVTIDGTDYYFTMKKLDGYNWTLLSIVPVNEVGVSTRAMTGSMIRLFLCILVVLLLLCIVAFFFLNRFRKNQELLSLRTRSAAELSQANRRLEDANAKLETTNIRLEAANKKLEEAQTATAEALAVAENASKAKTDFLSNMSHDIRTPMNAIVGLSNMIEREVDDPEKVLLHVRKLQSSSQHLLGIINDILDMNKIESGKTSLNIEAVNIAEQVAQLESMIRPQALERDQTFTVRTEHIQHENIFTDPIRMQQVLINILSNAVKYTPNGGQVDFEIQELPRQGHTYAKYQFTITDNGIGMDADFLQHIFDPFVRAENSVTNKVQGTGLGMAITKSIVELMGGTIHVESTPGKGSKFVVLLNFKIDTDTDQKLLPRRILVVGYDEAAIRNFEELDSASSLDAAFAETVEQALDILRACSSFDAILLAWSLSRETTAETVQQLRTAAGDSTYLLGMSTLEREAVQEKLDACGLDGYIKLPFFLSNLETELAHAQEHRLHPEPKEDASILKGMRFLCAEDNPLNAEILQAILDMNGASCTICSNGQEIVDAFAKVQPGEYDMILMDIQMPVMDGHTAACAIRNGPNPLGKVIPIIAMTANAFTDDIQKSYDAGMDAHLSKPVDIPTLEATIRKFRVTPPRNLQR